MKRIAILNFHRSFNYGAFLLCYSLVKKIEKDFTYAKIEVIDYVTESIMQYYDTSLLKFLFGSKELKLDKNLIFRLKSLAKSIITLIEDPSYLSKLRTRNRSFKQCLSYLPLSDYSIRSDDYRLLFEKIKNKYDVIIVGSDAVWNWLIRGFPNAYFLNEDLGAFKLSYAASLHGQDFSLVTTDKNLFLNKAFNDFSYIGVRDNPTEDFIIKVDRDLQPHHNCDPTLFLELDSLPVDMVKLRDKIVKRGIDFKKPIIGLMGGEWLGKEIRRLFGKENQIVAIYEPNRYADVFLYDLTPFEWARVFSFFQCTFTHFFHGTLLSLKNLTPTFPIERSTVYSDKFDTKIKDILNRLNLTEYYFTKEELDEKGWDFLKRKVDIVIQNPPKDKIIDALIKESVYYNDFKTSLESLLKV